MWRSIGGPVRVCLVATLGAALGVAFFQPPTGDPSEFFQLLRSHIGITDHDLSVTLPAGLPVAILLPVHNKGEVAVAGVERLGVPLEFFLDSFRKKPTFERGQQSLVTHEFSTPPVEEDLQEWKPQMDELRELPECSPGNCSVKLSASMMEQFHSTNGRPAAIDGRFRDLILNYLKNYLEQGDAAMITYADKLPPVQSSVQFRTLLKEFSWLSETAPPLFKCLADYPGQSSGNFCPQVDSFLYWSSAKFGFKPVFSITHVMIYRTVKDERPWVFIAFKQIYADHYFDGSLALAIVADQSADPTDPAIWVLYLNHSQTEVLSGFLGPIKKSIVQSRSRKATQKNLVDLKRNLERQYSVSPRDARR